MDINNLPIRLTDFQANSQFKKPQDLVIIAGPCVIESEELIYKIASEMQTICKELQLPYIFKASYDKANRTSINSFRGPGIDKGLALLNQVKKNLDLHIVSDIHSINEVEKAAEVLDIIQIPAFLCRQTDLIVEAAKTGKIINIKKGQFLAPHDVIHIVEKCKNAGNNNIIITERGTTFGYNNLVVDFRSFQILQNELKVPVIFDATHSVQMPGANNGTSGGKNEYVPLLASSAVASNVFGLFLETHPNPKEALSDGPNMVELSKMKSLLTRCKAIQKASYANPL